MPELSRLLSRLRAAVCVRHSYAERDALDEEGEPPKMTRSILIVIAVGVVVSVVAGTGCAEGGVGDPCIPEAEYDTCFAGFSVTEVNTESRSFQCQTRLCLVNHFQGRVSCPYGQTMSGTGPVQCADGTMPIGGGQATPCTSANPSPLTITAPPFCSGAPGAKAPPTCTIPGGAALGSAVASEYAIQVNVPPQETPRQTANAVYCSCRCENAQGNTNDGDVYCQCPDGFYCQQLVTAVSSGNANLAGGYCIKGSSPSDGTNYGTATTALTPCNPDPVAANPCP